MAVIKIENLKYIYPENEDPALENINLTIPEGQFVLIVGGSGSGKSSLIRAMAGLVPDFYGGVYGGNVYLDDTEIRRMDRKSLVQKVGMVFQDPESQLVMTNVEQEIAFGLENLGLSNNLMKRRVMEVTSALGLSDYLHSSSHTLSGGQKQKVALASVLAMQPEILILDEPTSQLDPIAGEEILTMVRRLNEENGITVVLVEQRLERCFHLADRVLVMDKGKITYDHHAPETIATWSHKNDTPFIPPLAKLFAHVGCPEVPVTVKQGRKILKSYFDMNSNDFKINIQPEKIKSHKIVKNKSLVDIQNLWFTYPDGKEILKNVNLEINEGDFTVLMGENGAGKTTLLKNINGLLKPSRGSIKILGEDTKKKMVEELAPLVGYLSQNPNDYLFLPTVKEELDFTLKNLGLSDDGISDEILRTLQVFNYKDRNPRDLSSGERQRVALASVLVARPKLLLLDEPTRGLDYELKEKLAEILLKIKATGTAILMITHDVEFAAEYAEDIVLMAEGSMIARGDKYEMLTNSTFYSPQISKLFHNIFDDIVTLKQGEEVLSNLLNFNNEKAI